MENTKAIDFALAAQQARAQVRPKVWGVLVPRISNEKPRVGEGKLVLGLRHLFDSRGSEDQETWVKNRGPLLGRELDIDLAKNRPTLGQPTPAQPDSMSCVDSSGALIIRPITCRVWKSGHALGKEFSFPIKLTYIPESLKEASGSGSRFAGIQSPQKEKHSAEFLSSQGAPSQENAILRAQVAKLAGDLALLQVELSLLKKG